MKVVVVEQQCLATTTNIGQDFVDNNRSFLLIYTYRDFIDKNIPYKH